MPTGFYKLKVDKIIRETADAVSVRFLVPPALKNQFVYKPGQYLTLHHEINGEDIRRSYSVCSSPYLDEMPTVAVKEVENGRMSTFLNRELKEGDLIDAMPPLGNFVVEPEESKQRHFVLFGGGSGITPLKSIALTILHKEPKSRIVLVYANRDTDSVIFEEELKQLEAEFGQRFRVIHSYDTPPAGWDGLSGFLNESKVQDILSKEFPTLAQMSQYYICGPGPMMDVVKNGLLGAGIANDQIHTEYFTASAEKGQGTSTTAAGEEYEEEIGDHMVKVEVYGEQHEIMVKQDQSILEAAQDAGLDPPYSCTVGVCTTCRAKVLHGRVNMDEREGLTDGEIAEGYVLTCQSHPVSKGVDLVYE